MYDIYDIEHYNTYKQLCLEFKDSLNENWVDVDDVSDLVLNDTIYIEYTPMSQKHLYEHTPECGVITSINKDFDQIFIINHTNNIIDIIKPGLGLYSSNYFITIYKVQK